MSRAGRRMFESLPFEIFLRIVLIALFCWMETVPPFVRYTTAEELQREHKYPRHDSYVPPALLWLVIVTAPLVTFAGFYTATGNKDEIIPSMLGITLALGINGVLTDTIKLMAGALRPDFFYRCFPDGVMTPDLVCTGDPQTVEDGRKSFPSGHSSFAFCALGFLAMWARARLYPWGARGCGAALMIGLLPLYGALLIATSRIRDYHHFGQDVVGGALIGLGCAYASYRLYYPSLLSGKVGHPYPPNAASPPRSPPNADESQPLLDDRRGCKST